VDDFLRQLQLTPTTTASADNGTEKATQERLNVANNKAWALPAKRYTTRYIPMIKVGGKLSFAAPPAERIRPKLTLTIAGDAGFYDARNDEENRAPGRLPYVAQFSKQYSHARSGKL
jgi:hypothetical protein